jgi:hypothetical protein
MSYLFGDSAPSPFRTNFIEFLRLAMGFCAHALSVEHRVLLEQTRRIRLEEEIDADGEHLQQLLGRLTNTIEDATAGAEPRVSGYAADIQNKAREVVDAGLETMRQSLTESVAEIAQSIKLERKSNLTPLEKVTLAYDFPEATNTVHLRLSDGGRYTAWLESVTPYRLETVIELSVTAESVFAHDVRVDKFVEGLELRAPETAGWIRKESRMVPQKLGRFHITELTLGETSLIKLRSSPEPQASGYDISVEVEEPQVRIVRIGKDAEGSGAFDPEPSDIPNVLKLRDKLEEAANALTGKRRALTSARIAEQPIDESTGMRAFVEQLVLVMAPMVREIAAHSFSPGELVLRRMMADDRREEIFVTKAELRTILGDLTEMDRELFAPLELHHDAPLAPAIVRRLSQAPMEEQREDRDPPSGIKRSNRPPPLRSGMGG